MIKLPAYEDTNLAFARCDYKVEFPDVKRQKCHSSLFSCIKFCYIGNVKQEVLNALKDGGGKYTMFTEFATHCILGDGYVEIEAADINDLYDEVQMVLQTWVLHSVYCNKLLPTKCFSYGNPNLLKNYSICLSKLNKSDCKLVWVLIMSNGGSFSLDLTANTTHLITTTTKSRKYEYASKIDRIKIISPQWLMDSIHNKTLANEALYHPRLLIDVDNNILPNNLKLNENYKYKQGNVSQDTNELIPISKNPSAVQRNSEPSTVVPSISYTANYQQIQFLKNINGSKYYNKITSRRTKRSK